MKIDADSIQDLIEQSGAFAGLMSRLDEIIAQKTQGLTRRLFKSGSLTVIGYGELPRQYSKSKDMLPLIGLAPQKTSVNLYFSCVVEGFPMPVAYTDQLGKVSVGKSCIRVKKIEHLNVDGLQRLIDDVLDWYNHSMLT